MSIISVEVNQETIEVVPHGVSPVTISITPLGVPGPTGDISAETAARIAADAALTAAVAGKQPANARLSDIAAALWVQGDIAYFDGANLVRLPAGASGHYLKTQGAGANPLWAAASGTVAGLTIASGKSLTVNSTLTLAGTDGTTMTFPASSASLARSDAAQSFTGLQTFNAGIVLANTQALQIKDNAGTARNVVQVDSGNALIFGSASLPGNAFFYPGSNQNLRFLNSTATRYFMEMRDSDTSLSFGSNTHDTWVTFHNSLATTGDTAISIRAGAAREARLRFGSNAGTYDVGLARDAAGILAVNDSSTTMTNFRDLRLRILYSGADQVVGARKTGWAAASGTATRTTFDTATVTLSQLAERVKALIDDLHATAGHGLIGA